MTQQIQELINKIKQEGIEQAQTKAKEVEAEARKKAEDIINEAKQRAEQLIANANTEAKRLNDTTQITLKQTARDMLLSVRKEIQILFNKIIAQEVHKAITPEELAQLISLTVKGSLQNKNNGADITVHLSEHDLKKLREGLLVKIKEEVKHPIKFHSSEGLGTGFTISFDSGKSCFDFSDKSLVEYLSQYLNQELSQLLKEAISSK